MFTRKQSTRLPKRVSIDDTDSDYLTSKNEPAYMKLKNKNKPNGGILSHDSAQSDHKLSLDDTESDYLTKKNQPAYVNFKRPNGILLNRSLDWQTSTGQATLKGRGATTRQESIVSMLNPREKLLVNRLEAMVDTAQAMLDTSNMADLSETRLEVLTEIMKCQHVIFKNLRSKKPDDRISYEQIYDEWKMISMIFDRVCFFVCLASLVINFLVCLLNKHVAFRNEDVIPEKNSWSKYFLSLFYNTPKSNSTVI